MADSDYVRDLAEAQQERDDAKGDCLHLARDLKNSEAQVRLLRERSGVKAAEEAQGEIERLRGHLKQIERISGAALHPSTGGDDATR